MEPLKISFLAVCLLIRCGEVRTVSTQSNHSRQDLRRHSDTPPFADWELGLRESVHQAFLREHRSNPDLREQLFEAPLMGRRRAATPFGDVAVLARGQLYITPEGFKFVQDSNPDGCSKCYDTRCVGGSVRCQSWKTTNHHHKLLALWTVKRIRHRDPRYGYVFEIEYTISPITAEINEELVRNRGYFNYNVPGHIFIIRSNPETSAGYHLYNGDKWYKNQATEYPVDQKKHGNGQFKSGIIIGEGTDGYKYVLQSYPGFYSSYRPHHDDRTTTDPKEYELYKKLIESLASKTSKLPHRFSVTESTKNTTATIKPPTTVPIAADFANGQLTPLTETTTTFHTTDFIDSTLQTPTLEPARPITMPITTINYYTPVEQVYETSTITTRQMLITTSRIPKESVTQETDNIYSIFLPTEIKTSQRTTDQMSTTALTSTEPITENPQRTSPNSINEQLPPPIKSTETTLPYTSGITTQPSIVEKQETKPMKKTTIVGTSTLVPTITDEATTVRETTAFTEQVSVPTKQEEISTTPLRRDQTTSMFTATTSEVPLTETTSTLPSTTDFIPVTQQTTNYKTPTTTDSSFETPQNTTATVTNPTTPTTLSYYSTFDTAILTTTEKVTSTTPTETTKYENTVTTSTRKTYEKTNASTTPSDFLIDEEAKDHRDETLHTKKEFNDDDIFGTTPKKISTKSPKPTRKVPVIQSDLAQTLFGRRRSKQRKLKKQHGTPDPKIIYDNFYTNPTTTASPDNITKTSSTTEYWLSTDQSFSTSISFEVNRKNNRKFNLANNKNNSVYKTEPPLSKLPVEKSENSTNETRNVFDDFAQQLVNHARTIDILKPKTPQRPKDKRRSFATRKRSQRRHFKTNKKEPK